MTLIEKIEKVLSLSTTDDKGNLFIYENAVKDLFKNDEDYDTILEKANGVCDIFNNTKNKESISEMEVEDILKLIK